MFTGICGGLAEYFNNIDPTLVRLAVVIAAVMTAGIPAIIIYIIASFVIPEAGTDG